MAVLGVKLMEINSSLFTRWVDLKGRPNSKEFPPTTTSDHTTACVWVNFHVHFKPLCAAQDNHMMPWATRIFGTLNQKTSGKKREEPVTVTPEVLGWLTGSRIEMVLNWRGFSKAKKKC